MRNLEDWLELASTLGRNARSAARALANASTEEKNETLERIAQLLENRMEFVLDANRADVEAGRVAGLSEALLDRLTLTPERLSGMAQSVREVAALPDPVGEITDTTIRPNGIEVSRVRIPLGVILIIYEARPNVTAEAAALCIKSGNAVVLRGGKEALRSNIAVATLISEALAGEGLAGAVTMVEDTDRDLMLALLQQETFIDLAIPRGGEGLIRFVAENSRVPVIKHYKGVCHLYVDAEADPAMAVELVLNAKCSRPGVCNALECLLVHKDAAEKVLPEVGMRLREAGVRLHADERAMPLLGQAENVVPASESDYGQEYLDLVLPVKVVDSYEQAVAHIARYGSLHTEVIVTENEATAKRFTREVEASMVGWNVSTRFNDGGQLGLGAEMGISTTKMHAFGPMGLRELTTQKFVVTGRGQVRR